MRRRLVSALLLALSLTPPAQVRADEASAEPEGTLVFERPPEGARRGLLSVPEGVVYALSAVGLVASFAYLGVRIRRTRRRS